MLGLLCRLGGTAPQAVVSLEITDATAAMLPGIDHRPIRLAAIARLVDALTRAAPAGLVLDFDLTEEGRTPADVEELTRIARRSIQER